MIPQVEMLDTRALQQFCDYVWDGDRMQHEPESGVVFCHTDNIAEFFKRCRKNRYILISAESDFGLHRQAEHHPNQDLRKLLGYVPWDKAGQVRDKYLSVPIGPACRADRCDPTHEFSLKSFNHTHATFDAIPDNIVKWFVANNNVKHERVEWAPFGLLMPTPPRLSLSPKRGLLYVNFELYTDYRIALKEQFSQKPWATSTPRANLPRERYWQDIAEHRFVLCPTGNGLDCYRNYETWYLGSIPVMERSTFTEQFAAQKLPVLFVKSFFELSDTFLAGVWELFQNRSMYNGLVSLDAIKLSTWRQRIDDARKLLAV